MFLSHHHHHLEFSTDVFLSPTTTTTTTTTPCTVLVAITPGGGSADGDVTEISRTAVCQDYAEHCARCGPPAGFVVYQKELLPITGVHFNITGGVTVVVESVKCTG